MGSPESIDRRARFDEVRYANCWEDAAVLARALEPVAGARCLSIASGGDNALFLVARGAAHVLAVDVSPAQLALVQLKARAFAALDHADLLAFLGVRPSSARLATYRGLRSSLDDSARAFWDARTAQLERGVIHAGRFERYLRLFRDFVLPLVHGRRTVSALFEPRDAAARRAFYDQRWDRARWRALFRLFFSRLVLGRLGRDPAFFDHVQGPVAERLLARTRKAFTSLPLHENPYVRYALLGAFGDALPDYLRPEHHAAIREGLPRLERRQGRLEDVVRELPTASVDAFNLSDVAEYMSATEFARLLVALHRVASPGARFAYWNLLAPRRRPEGLADRLATRDAAALHGEARAFFYQALVLEVAR
jgi:S-adenosylmethionine:diacylglycerol 3-amino-3-carboxypropyl transferase